MNRADTVHDKEHRIRRSSDSSPPEGDSPQHVLLRPRHIRPEKRIPFGKKAFRTGGFRRHGRCLLFFFAPLSCFVQLFLL